MMEKAEELINSYIESGKYINDNYMDRNVKIHNFHERSMMKIKEYLEKENLLELLHPLLKHPVDFTRFSAAYDLLPFYEEDAKVVYQEIIKNIPMMSYDAQISLQQWEESKRSEKQPCKIPHISLSAEYTLRGITDVA